LKDRWINFPVNPAKAPVFYGWLIIPVGIVGMLMSIPGQTMGVSVFTDHLLNDYHITRSDLGLAYGIGTAASGLLIIFAGMLYDRYGSRIMATWAGILLGFSLIFLTKLDKIGIMLENNRNISREVSIIPLLVIGFFGIRFFGQGVLTMSSRNMVMKWFDKKRGLANAWLSSFVVFGFSAAPYFLFTLVDEFGWRGAWINTGIAIGFIFSVFAFLFFRDNPRQCGLIPDGQIIKGTREGKTPATPDKDYKLGYVIRTYSFWIYNFTMVIHALYITALTFQVKSVFEQAGHSERIAFMFFIPVAVVSVFFNFGASWLSDYIRLKYLLLAYLFMLMISVISLLFLENGNWILILLITGTGAASGVYGALSSVVWPRLFGTAHLGEISGFAMSWMVIGSAVGPYLFAISIENTGSYYTAIIICLIISLLLFVLGFWANNINDQGAFQQAGKR